MDRAGQIHAEYAEVSPLDLFFQQERSLSIGPHTRHVWMFSNLSKLSQHYCAVNWNCSNYKMLVT